MQVMHKKGENKENLNKIFLHQENIFKCLILKQILFASRIGSLLKPA
jgi:hypothetical protein